MEPEFLQDPLYNISCSVHQSIYRMQASVLSDESHHLATNWFDRIFISAVIGIALELFWMRLLEQSLPLWVAHVIVLGLTVVIVAKD